MGGSLQIFLIRPPATKIYDEAQVEAYRRLGECAAESPFRPEISDPYLADRPGVSSSETAIRFKTLDQWFQSLGNSLLPDNDEVFDQDNQASRAAP